MSIEFFALCFVVLASIVSIILLSISIGNLRAALKEVRRARLEIRSHAPLQAAKKKTFDERRKEEYEKRGIPWEG